MRGDQVHSRDADTERNTVPVRLPEAGRPRHGGRRAVAAALAPLALLGGLAVLLAESERPGLDASGAGTLLVFAAAVVGWISDRLDDTFVALAAAAGMVLLGSLETEDLFETLGSEPIWLLVAAFVLAAGVSRTGLPARVATLLVARARSPRGLIHLTTIGLLVTALLVPSTSGRAALALPIYAVLATALTARERLVRALAVLFPTVVLLSAIATLVGAGAHLITSQILDDTIDRGIGFAQWLLWGAPFAVASSHLAAEIVLLLFTRRADRTEPLRIDATELRTELAIPARMRRSEIRAALLLTAVVVLWSTEPLHGFPPALVALFGALLITAPRVGTVELTSAISDIPWSLLLFMAATAGLGTALTESGVAGWIAAHLLVGGGFELLVLVVAVSVAAHLLVQSRSARSSVLIPLVIPAAVAAGMNPVALAFASTAAAGFCHTLPSSAKPVAMFARVDGVPTYTSRDLLRLSALLGPVLLGLVLLFALCVWPALGLPLR